MEFPGIRNKSQRAMKIGVIKSSYMVAVVFIALSCAALQKQPGSTSRKQLCKPERQEQSFPWSTKDKFHLLLNKTYSPYTVAGTAFNATWAQMTGQWYQYGGGMQGWGKRFGATLADTEGRALIQSFALSSVLRQDPRYFHSFKKGLIPRAWYAGTRVLVTRNDQGQSTLNTSELLGALFASSLENAYYPSSDRGFNQTMTRYIGAIGSDATTNLLREFWPDIRRILRRHSPERIKQIEDRIPGASKAVCR